MLHRLTASCGSRFSYKNGDFVRGCAPRYIFDVSLPLRLSRQMPELHIAWFKTGRFVPNRFAHVGFYLPDRDGDLPGSIHHVQKSGIVSERTKYEVLSFEQPLRNSKKETVVKESDLLERIPLEIQVEATELSRACHFATQDRPFNLLTRNCQHWAYEVIEYVVIGLKMKNGEDVLKRTKKLMQRRRRRDCRGRFLRREGTQPLGNLSRP